MHTPEPTGPAAGAPQVPAGSPFLWWSSFPRFLYSQNPFYLLSVACVLHSTRLWYRDPSGPYDPWPLMGVICGYILLLAATGFVLIRFGKVWDDARSILLMLLLLFVELSLTFDEVLIGDRRTGMALLLLGWTLAVLVSEGLLLGLTMRLPALYRVPYHLFLGLLFLYPLVIVSTQSAAPALWRVYLFSPVAALILLTLVPAIRRGAAYVKDNGTPWAWPLYPWSLFVFFGICVTLRSYALCMSFDPVLSQNLEDAMRLDSAFGGYFIAPIALAAGVLLMEAGLVTRRPSLQFAALLVPVLCLALSWPRPGMSVPYAEFLGRFTATLGSPFWIAALAAVAFYAYARGRGVRAAEPACVAATALLACVERGALYQPLTFEPSPIWLWAVACVGAALGIRRRSSAWCFAGSLAAVVALRATWLTDAGWLLRNAAPAHLVAAVMLLLGAIYRDDCARLLRKGGGCLLLLGACSAALWPSGYPHELSEGLRSAYLACVIATAFVYSWAFTSPFMFYVAAIGGFAALVRWLIELAHLLRAVWRWDGAAYFVVGLALFAVGVLISATKSGLVKRLGRVVPRRA